MMMLVILNNITLTLESSERKKNDHNGAEINRKDTPLCSTKNDYYGGFFVVARF